jgi:hypothetical protein
VQRSYRFPCTADEFGSADMTRSRGSSIVPRIRRQHRVCTYRDDDANEAAHHERKTAMKIVPTRIEEQINRVDRTKSLGIGIASGITALWCVYRLGRPECVSLVDNRGRSHPVSHQQQKCCCLKRVSEEPVVVSSRRDDVLHAVQQSLWG